MTHRFHRSSSARALSLAIAATVLDAGGFTLLFLASDAARAAETASTACPTLSNEQQRILQAATGGVDALRDHLWIRRGIHPVDLVETVRWIDAVRQSSAGCGPGAARETIARAEAQADAAERAAH